MSLLSTTIGSKYLCPPKPRLLRLSAAAIVSSGVANSSNVAPLDAMYDAWIVLDCARQRRQTNHPRNRTSRRLMHLAMCIAQKINTSIRSAVTDIPAMIVS